MSTEPVEMVDDEQMPWDVFDAPAGDWRMAQTMRGDLSVVIHMMPRLCPGALFGLQLDEYCYTMFHPSQRPMVFVDGEQIGLAGRGPVPFSPIVIGQPRRLAARVANDPREPTPFLLALMSGKELRVVVPTAARETLAWTFDLTGAKSMIEEALGIGPIPVPAACGQP